MFTCTRISLGYTLKVEWLGYRIHMPSLVLGIFQLLLFQLILPTLLSIVQLNNFCQSTWCEMVNHSGFYYHFPGYW